MSTDEYVPSEDEEWALVDLLGSIIEDANDEPQFTVSEHALMAAGTIRREWLAAHDARVRRDAAREALDGYAAVEEDSFLSLHVKDAPIAAAQCTHAAITAREYRDTHYPEETP